MNSKLRKIYLDNAASTAVFKQVFKKMRGFFDIDFGNPSSIHEMGEIGQRAIQEAKDKAAKFLGCDSKEIIFTSGATEANNLAILGFSRRAKKLMAEKNLNIVVSGIEHDSVLVTARELEKEGIELRIVLPNQEGRISPQEISKLIDENTILVSIMYANNETGAIQPIKEISEIIKNIRKKNNSILPAFHTDAVQAANYLSCKVYDLGVDLLVLSSHKIYGPKGAGLLYIRKGISVDPIIFGGGQEFKLRSGTENVPAIVGFGEAIDEINSELYAKKIKTLRDSLENNILKLIPDVKIISEKANRLPNISYLLFDGIEGEAIALTLNEKNIYVSTGSACSSKSLHASHVLLAQGVSPKDAHGSVRFSLGKDTKTEEIKIVLKELPVIIEKLRSMSPFYDKEKLKIIEEK